MSQGNLKDEWDWREKVVAPPLRLRINTRFSVGLARSCNNESDWLIPGENIYPMIPRDAIECSIPPLCLS